METLGRSSTPMPLALENTPNYNSPTVVGCAGSKPLTITWNREEWPLSLLGNATSTSFTTCIARGKAASTFERVQYRYLGQRNSGARPNSVRDDDTHRFEQLKVALKTIGLSKQHIAQTCQLIAAILHLGNLEFTIDRSRDVDAAVVRNTDTLALVADFLGVQPSALENALSYKTKMVKKELCTVFLDPDGASDNRDDLAKTLYSLLFAWLNEHINQRLCRDDFDTFIGLFDLPGPQNMTGRPNSLDQFCINFANERLHHFIQHQLFESHVDEYKT